jgi:hypothetical protein
MWPGILGDSNVFGLYDAKSADLKPKPPAAEPTHTACAQVAPAEQPAPTSEMRRSNRSWQAPAVTVLSLRAAPPGAATAA